MQAEHPQSFLFSFPFVVLVDTRNPPQLEMTRIGSSQVRFYPLFRSAPANWIPMPSIQAYSVPFLDGHTPEHVVDDGSVLITLAVNPQLAIPGVQEASVHLAWGANWETDKIPICFPMDSLRIDIIPGEGSPENEANPSLITKRLLHHIRALTKQWWITRSSDPLLGWMRNEFPTDAYGKPQGEIYSASKGQTPSGIESPLTSTLWSKAIRETEALRDPDVVDQLLLDAEYFRVSEDNRRLVLDAASACEVAKDEAFQRVWSRVNLKPYRRGKLLSGWDIGKHLDTDLQSLCGRSLKSENPSLHNDVKCLWDARGNVAHGEAAYFRRDNQQVEVEGDVAIQLVRSAQSCVKWLRSL